MIELLNQIYNLSKILNLNRKDINYVFYSRKWKSNILFILLILAFSIFIIMFIVIISNISGIYIQEHTYQTGTKYSTVKIQDFSKKNENKYRLWKKVRTWIS
jgi:hypothetical protein